MATLQEKLAGLETQFKQLVETAQTTQINANAVQGAIQFCKHLIEEEAAEVNIHPQEINNG